jgi:nucleotide-binding universal stress UspA family protein
MEPKHPQVVVAYDFSPLFGRAVLDRAIGLVSRAPQHTLHFVTVIDPHHGVPIVPPDGPIDYAYADRVRDKMSEEIAKAFGEQAIPAEVRFFIHPRIGKAADEILELGKEVGADLILIGTHGFRGFQRLVMGSVAERVVRDAGCPVLIARPKTYPDVELVTVVEVERASPIPTRMHQFSYVNHAVIMRPPEWPI